MANTARCALFVDHENIWLSLKKAYGPAIIDDNFAEDLAQALLETCRNHGELEYWAAVADWTKGDFSRHAQSYNRYTFDVVLNLTGPNNADLKIQNAINDLLTRRPEIETYIVATGDRGYQPIVQRLMFNHKHAVVWGVRGATNATLQTFASEFEHLDVVLADILKSGLNRYNRAPARQAPATKPPQPVPPQPDWRMLPLIEPRDKAGSLSNLDALIVYVDYYMRANNFGFVTFAKFLDFLNQRNLVGLSDDEREMWLKSAVASDMFTNEEVRLTDHHTGEAKTIRRFRLSEGHARVVETRKVIKHVLEFLTETLTGPFNPSFSKLRDQLQQALPELSLDRVHNWLSWLKETNVLLTKEVPHKKDPSIRVKLVRLNPDHFLVRHLAAGPYSGPEELLICVIDAHLIEHGHAWMAASKLLERIADKLTSDGKPPAEARREAKEILDAAKLGRLVRVAKPGTPAEGEEPLYPDELPAPEQAPGPFAPPASQVYLERDHERVHELIERRNAMIRIMHESLRGRAWIARSTYQREVATLFVPAGEIEAPPDVLAEAPNAGALPHEQIHFWINLLIYLRNFLPRQVPNPRGGTTNALMLNPSSRVAAEALADYLAAVAPTEVEPAEAAHVNQG